MDTRRLLANEANVAAAARLLAAGELVAFPTETVYGLGASAARADAVTALFRVKQRPLDRPLALLVAGEEMARDYVTVWPPLARKLARAFWPGPLTMVLPRSARVNDEVAAGGDTVALRAPNHAAAQGLVAQLGGAIATPSANLFGAPAPLEAAAVMAALGGRISLVLDGGRCRLGVASTIVAIAEEVRILRHGAIDAAAIEALLAADSA